MCTDILIGTDVKPVLPKVQLACCSNINHNSMAQPRFTFTASDVAVYVTDSSELMKAAKLQPQDQNRVTKLCDSLQSAGGPRAQRAERECQTKEVKQRGNQTVREAHVQMARPDLLLDTCRDRTLTASMLYTSASAAVVHASSCPCVTEELLQQVRVPSELTAPHAPCCQAHATEATALS